LLTWALGIAVVACAILLGILIGRPLWRQNRAVATYSATSRDSAAQVSKASPAPAEDATNDKQAGNPVPSRQSLAEGRTRVPEGGLLVFENGKEVFRMPGAQEEEPKSLEKLSPVEAQSGLIHRVEPEYPEAARRAGIQGAVVLDVSIGSNGAVQNVQVVSGPEELAQASIDAVKQWRFRPHRVAGRSANMQTAVTLNFRLPR
jgi:TonB family protein